MSYKNKKNKLIVISIIVLLSKLFSNSYSKPLKVKVMIFDNVKEVTVSLYNCDELLVSTVKTYSKIKIKKPIKIFFVDKDTISIGNKKFKLPVTLNCEDKIVVNKKIYDGEIKIYPAKQSKSMRLINIISLEQYLYGVLPYEIEPSWNEEMLKLQSIISRTYALANLGRHKTDGYDFCSTQHCQIYNGINIRLVQKIKKIVDSTKGLVIVDKNGLPIHAYYCSSCGGEIEDISEVWNVVISPKYLQHKKCNFCKTSPYYSWERYVKKEWLKKVLVSKGYKIKEIKGLKIISRTSSGRAKQIAIISQQNEIVLPAESLRSLIGYNILLSTKIDEIKVFQDELYFRGRGWGHGVGLCQWGANFMAASGKKVIDIVRFYYPTTTIKKKY